MLHATRHSNIHDQGVCWLKTLDSTVVEVELNFFADDAALSSVSPTAVLIAL